MDKPKPDIAWHSETPAVGQPRLAFVHDILRYAQGANQSDVLLDEHINYHWLTSPQALGRPKIMLEAGINAPAEVVGPDGVRRPLIAIRSSPWKAGHETNPWHDEFDLDHGHVRYFGDHKPSTVGLPGETKGNRLLLQAARLHAGTSRESRGPPGTIGFSFRPRLVSSQWHAPRSDISTTTAPITGSRRRSSADVSVLF